MLITRYQYQWGGWVVTGPQVNRFKQIPTGRHHMSVAGGMGMWGGVIGYVGDRVCGARDCGGGVRKYRGGGKYPCPSVSWVTVTWGSPQTE